MVAPVAVRHPSRGRLDGRTRFAAGVDLDEEIARSPAHPWCEHRSDQARRLITSPEAHRHHEQHASPASQRLHPASARSSRSASPPSPSRSSPSSPSAGSAAATGAATASRRPAAGTSPSAIPSAPSPVTPPPSAEPTAKPTPTQPIPATPKPTRTPSAAPTNMSGEPTPITVHLATANDADVHVTSSTTPAGWSMPSRARPRKAPRSKPGRSTSRTSTPGRSS